MRRVEADLTHSPYVDTVVLDDIVAAEAGDRLLHVDQVLLVDPASAPRTQPQDAADEGQRQQEHEEPNQDVVGLSIHTDACAARPRGP